MGPIDEHEPRELTAGDWAALAMGVGQLGPLVFGPDVPKTPLHRAEGTRYLLRFMAAGILTCVEHTDPTDPELVRFIDPRISWGLDNPDCNYRLCGIDPAGTYRLWGDPGTATAWELQVNTGHFADGRATEWRCVASLRDEALDRGADVEVVIGPDPPADLPAGAHFLRTEPEATHVFLREYVGDWGAERPGSLCMERLDVRLPAPPRTEHEIGGRLDLLGTWLDAGARCWWDWGRALAEGPVGPIEPFVAPASSTGLTGQAYGMGGYRCRPDEAVILELVPPACRYWSVALATWFWETSSTGSRQVSLNHTQAATDPDGVVRFVIAQRDPGVANWLDAAGYEAGTVAVRYLWADTVPTVGYRTVPFGRLRDELPLATRTVTPVERDAGLRARRAALQRRMRR